MNVYQCAQVWNTASAKKAYSSSGATCPRAVMHINKSDITNTYINESINKQQNTNFTNRSLVYSLGSLESYDLHEIVPPKVSVYYSTKRSLGRNSSTLLQNDHVSNSHILSRMLPFVELFNTLSFPMLPEMSYQCCNRSTSTLQQILKDLRIRECCNRISNEVMIMGQHLNTIIISRTTKNQWIAIHSTCMRTVMNSLNVNLTGETMCLRCFFTLLTPDSHNAPKWRDVLPLNTVTVGRYTFLKWFSV